jgi:hypothetical protein
MNNILAELNIIPKSRKMNKMQKKHNVNVTITYNTGANTELPGNINKAELHRFTTETYDNQYAYRFPHSYMSKIQFQYP